MKRQSLSAGFAMYPMEVVKEVGGFDEFYSISMDGVELSSRIGVYGYDLFCLPTAKGYHFHSLFRSTINNPGQGEEGRYWSTYGNILKNDLTSEIQSSTHNINPYCLDSPCNMMILFLEILYKNNKEKKIYHFLLMVLLNLQT